MLNDQSTLRIQLRFKNGYDFKSRDTIKTWMSQYASRVLRMT